MNSNTNSNEVDYNEVDYNDIFVTAKENAIFSHAMVWIREVLKDDRKSDNEKFILIEKIVYEAQKHLPGEK